MTRVSAKGVFVGGVLEIVATYAVLIPLMLIAAAQLNLAELPEPEFSDALGKAVVAEEAAAAMQAQYADTREWAVLPVPGAAGLDVALFSSGMGDGAYSSYWGFDAGGQAVCLLTDFDILGRQGEGAAAKPWWKFW